MVVVPIVPSHLQNPTQGRSLWRTYLQELWFFVFLSSLDTLTMLRKSELLSSVNEILLLAARRALLRMPSIQEGDAITRTLNG